jgi:hypothetical protein
MDIIVISPVSLNPVIPKSRTKGEQARTQEQGRDAVDRPMRPNVGVRFDKPVGSFAIIIVTPSSQLCQVRFKYLFLLFILLS